LRIDGGTVGSMTCSGSAGPFAVSTGSHTIQACDVEGCVTDNTSVSSGQTITFELFCSAGAQQRGLRVPF
jgi:hypothetical protein